MVNLMSPSFFMGYILYQNPGGVTFPRPEVGDLVSDQLKDDIISSMEQGKESVLKKEPSKYIIHFGHLVNQRRPKERRG